MKKTNYFIILSLIFAFYCPSCSADVTSKHVEKKKENVLFIVVDDLNNTLGTSGHPTVLTPNIDKLASQGIQFNKAYCNYVVCNPSRSSFLMGFLPEALGITDNIIPLQTKIGERISLPALFKKNGYYTSSLGKVFHGNAEHNDPYAWDDILGFSATELGKKGEERNLTDGELKWCRWQAAEGADLDQPDGQVAEKAISIIKSNKGQSFFLAVGFHKPQDPFIAPKKYFDMYPLVVCDPPILPEGWTAPYKYSLPVQKDIFSRFTNQDRREFLRSYYACTSFMDTQVGKVIDAVKEAGILENTLMVWVIIWESTSGGVK